MSYDLIVIGGGIAGSSLARCMAGSGARVLVLERETQFRDRIRGECMQPWGVAEAKLLGVEPLLRKQSLELRWFDQTINGQHAFRRDLIQTTPHACGVYAFYHPAAQEVLLNAAQEAGAEVRRGATAWRVAPGARPRVWFDEPHRSSTEAEARLIAICAGRNPGLRSDLGFQTSRGSIPLLLSGIWLSNLSSDVEPDVAYICNDTRSGSVSALFPQPDGRARAYFGFHPNHCERLQGLDSFTRFRMEFNASSGGLVPFADATPEGPLASFECADVWVDHPYRDGVALVGDAASSNDPSWGQGLSLALRDARVLSDELLKSSDWNVAGHHYAELHDQHYGVVRKVSGWFYDLFQRLGPEADARRMRALPLIGQEPDRVPDVICCGPDFPLNAESRARFFAEDVIKATA